MNAFNLITGTYESRILTKHGFGECKYKVYRRTCDLNQTEITINVGASVKIWQTMACAKNYIWNAATCACQSGDMGSFQWNFVHTCHESFNIWQY